MKKEIKQKRVKTARLQVLCLCCKELFWTTEYLISIGRKYCSMECVANDKHFGVGDDSKNKIKRI
jgi:hypothetical protein